MPGYDAILFDFDGVLVDTEPSHFKCWHSIMAELGISLSWEVYAGACIGASQKQMLQRLSALSTPPLPLESLSAPYARKQQRFLDLAQQGIPIEREIEILIQSLAKSMSLAVVTSSPRNQVHQILSAAGMLKHFAVLVCSEDVSEHKPDPAPVHNGCQAPWSEESVGCRGLSARNSERVSRRL